MHDSRAIIKIMYLLSRHELEIKLKEARVSKRLQRDLRYMPEAVTKPEMRDFLVVSTKSGNEGVLLFGDRIVQFSLDRRRSNSAGRVEAIICDICATWQRGLNSAILTLKKDSSRTVSYLVCGDLECSMHVRGLTAASTLSRTQLREHITPEARVERLQDKLRQIVEEIAIIEQ